MHPAAPPCTALHRPAPPCTALHSPAQPCTALQSRLLLLHHALVQCPLPCPALHTAMSTALPCPTQCNVHCPALHYTLQCPLPCPALPCPALHYTLQCPLPCPALPCPALHTAMSTALHYTSILDGTCTHLLHSNFLIIAGARMSYQATPALVNNHFWCQRVLYSIMLTSAAVHYLPSPRRHMMHKL